MMRRKQKSISGVLPLSGLVVLGSLLLAGCEKEKDQAAAPARPVRVVSVEKGIGGETVSFTGDIQAEDEASLAFRISGRMIDRLVNVGDQVKAGQLVARLDAQNATNNLRSAQAALTATQGRLVQAENHYERQERLLQNGFTTRALYDDALQGLQTARAQVDDAQAQLRIAEDNLSYTELRADAPGVVTARGAEPGEVVQAGRMIVQLARQGGRDAVFDVPAQVLRVKYADPVVRITLSGDTSVVATGRVREIAPQADPVTRTFRVRVGLDNPPESMRLGATVIGQVQLGGETQIEVPASALTAFNSQPAVWVVDPETMTVSLRNVDMARFNPATVVVSSGLAVGDIVVTAGVQALHPGQKVRLLGSRS